MAETNDEAKAESASSNKEDTGASTQVGLDPEMSPEEVDAFLAEEDPEFTKNLQAIQADKTLSLDPIFADDVDTALSAEVERWNKAVGFWRLLYRVLPFLPKITLRWNRLKFRIFSWCRAWWVRLKNFAYYLATEGRKKLKDKLLGGLKASWKFFIDVQEQVGALPLRLKFTFLAVVALLGLAGATVYYSYTRGLLPKEEELFLSNIDSIATESWSYDPVDEVEPYYDNIRTSQNVLLFEKMVVNIKPSKNSGPNPMAAFEFYIEGSSQEATVDLKRQEIRARDMIMRLLEGFSFDELDSLEGKKEMAFQIQKELNSILAVGRVKNVRLKTMVVKP